MVEINESGASPTRTAIHAALADEHRLGIVDALAVADLSPGELSTALDLPSNLLAHHLRVLESAGIVRRCRSEGDGRRAYLTLNWSEPIVAATAASAVGLSARRIVFVCTHNSARSQFAASLLAERVSEDVDCAGTAPAEQIHPIAASQLAERGLRPLHDRPQAYAGTARDGDLVIAVCDNAYEELAGSPDHRALLHWSVPDPARTADPADFSSSFTTIEARVDRLALALQNG